MEDIMQDLQKIIEEVKKQKEFYGKEKLRLKKEISKLPIGSIQKKIIRSHLYYYLLYRKKGKVTHDYIGKKVPLKLQKQISARQSLVAELRPINEKLKILRKFKV